MQFVPFPEDGMEKGLCVNRRAVHKQVLRLRELASKGQINVGQVEGRMIRSISVMVPIIFWAC